MKIQVLVNGKEVCFSITDNYLFTIAYLNQLQKELNKEVKPERKSFIIEDTTYICEYKAITIGDIVINDSSTPFSYLFIEHKFNTNDLGWVVVGWSK